GHRVNCLTRDGTPISLDARPAHPRSHVERSTTEAPVTKKIAANISLLFAEKPYLERPAAAAAAGFSAIETWWPFGADPSPPAVEVERLVAAVDRAGVELVACNLFAGDMPAGERGVVSLPDRRDDLHASLSVIDELGRRTGCRLFNALYGVRDERFD